MQIIEGKVIPGVAIGEYYIGMKKEDLIKKLGDDYINEWLGDGEHKVILENAMIWIDKNGLVDQIGVSKGFRSAYQDKVRIGTTLNEIKVMYGGYGEESDTYNLIGVDGMCFELEDIDEFEYLDESDILRSPIEWIFVYRIPQEQGSVTQIVEGRVIPSEGIGDYYIGMKKEDLIKKLGSSYTEYSLGGGKSKICLENAMIWINADGLVEQIGVSKGFQGAYQYYLRIGMTLEEVRTVFWEYEKENDIYRLVGVDGLSFMLEGSNNISDDKMGELNLPIEWIFVYRISDR